MTTGIIPVGYAVGFTRALSNKAEVLIRGKKVRQVGIICMDLSVIDITDVPGVTIGDEVVLIGHQGDQQLTIEEMAQKSNTIPYETMCVLGHTIKRVYV